MRTTRTTLVYTLLAVLALGGGYWVSHLLPSPAVATDSAEDTLIPFELPTSTGDKWSTLAVTNKVVLVNFWATWCAPCRTEIPLLMAAQARHAGVLQVVGIAIDSPEPVRRFEDETGLNYVSLISESAGYELMRRYGNPGNLPFTLVFDRDGMLKYRKTGQFKPSELAGWLSLLL